MCGGYLAASTTQGHMYVWSVSGGHLIEKLQTNNKQHICGLAWNPKPEISQLAFCDVAGNFGTVDNVDCVKDSSVKLKVMC